MIKFKCEITGMSSKKNSARINIKASALDLPETVKLLGLLTDTFDMVFVENKAKIKVLNVLFDGMSVNSDGESKIKFEVEPSQMPIVAEINALQNPLLAIKVKSNAKQLNSGGDSDDS